MTQKKSESSATARNRETMILAPADALRGILRCIQACAKYAENIDATSTECSQSGQKRHNENDDE